MKNKTEIFADYSAFLNRADKKVNGVTQEFSDENPNYETENESNQACWNCSDCRYCRACSYCSDCSDCSDCSYCRACRACSYCSDCSACSACSYCSACSDCSYCRACSACSDCSDCRACRACSYCSYCSDFREKDGGKSGGESSAKSWFDVPNITNIHQAILAATENPDALNMSNWHTCDTTHCRAGWVVHLAGAKGAALEKASSTLFAALHIYKASSPDIPVSPVRFFETDEVAMADIRRCAELEKAANPTA